MRIIKTIIKLVLTVLMVITSFHVNALPVKAASTEGKAFGVLQDDGELLIIRSNDPFDEYTYVYENKTITDIFGKEYTGTAFYGVEKGIFRWTTDNEKYAVKSFRIEDGIVFIPKALDGMFYGMNQLESVSLEGIDISEVTEMDNMFTMCENLKSIRFPDTFDTSNITNFESAFSCCYALESVDISGFDFSNAENLRSMFNSCWKLKSVKLPANAKTDKVKDFRLMFYDCFALEELDLSGFSTRSAETMSNMFGYCGELRKLDISNFDTRKTDRDYGVQYMLYEMNKLEELKVGPYFENWKDVYLAQGRWKNGSLTKTTDELVRGYAANATAWAGTWVRDFDLIENLVLNGYEPLIPGETGRVYYYTLPGDNVKTDLLWSSSDESVATVDEKGIIHAKKAGETVITAKTTDGSNLESSIKVIVREDIAYGILSDEGEMVLIRVKAKYDTTVDKMITVTDINGVSYTGYLFGDVESHDTPDWYQWHPEVGTWVEKIKKFRIAEGTTIKPIRFSWWLSDAINLEEVDFTGIDTSEITDFIGMFYNDRNLKKINFGTMDTSAAEAMAGMFDKCVALEEITFGEKFTKYIKGTDLPPGIWSNGTQSYRNNEFVEKFSADTTGLTGTWTRTVIKATSFNIIPDELTLYVGAWGQFEYEFKPDDATISMEWSSSDEDGLYVWGSSNYERRKVGTYTVTAHTTEGSDLTDTVTVKVVEAKPTVSGITRVYGSTRFGTSFAISDTILMNSGNEKHDTVILANGDNFADALAGSYLAAVKGAPIIITRAKMVNEVNAYIRSVLSDGGTIYVLGGTAAVPESSLAGLTGKGFKIKRLAGNTRYETNLEILKEAGISGDTILIATGTNYADSLSASATGLPMLLVKGTDKLNDVQKKFLKDNPNKKLIVLGGVSAVSSNFENELMNYGSVIRIAGDTRFATSIKIAEYFFPDASRAVLAYGSDFPDGLCGGPLAHQIGAPLILTRNDQTDVARPYTKARNITDGYALGGTKVLPDATVRKLFGAFSSVPIKEIMK